MSFTPRRSVRSAIFTPSPHPSAASKQVAEATTFHWLSSASYPSGPDKPHYTSYKRLVNKAALAKRRRRTNPGIEESRFAIGDGVLVNVEGGNDGVGILVKLWEEEDSDSEDEDDSDSDSDDSDDDHAGETVGAGVGGGKGNSKKSMLAEIHWCFRRQDLPGIMKNLTVAENEVLLAASPVRRVSTSLPISLLVRTVPIYSRSFFKKQFEPGVTSVRGWTYARQGVFWCDRAFDKGARGGKVWRIDVDSWREGGKAGHGWTVSTEPLPNLPPGEEDASDDEDDEGDDFDVDQEEEEEEDEVDDEGQPIKKKRKLQSAGVAAAVGKMPIPGRAPRKQKRVPHPSAPATFLPSSIPRLEDLPTEPYERALRLLHVGATPESLPCREEEFVDVLTRVEEGVESGGGGCLYIAGVPGTGKTATVHAVVKELKRKAEDGELSPFSYVEINGLKIPSPQHAYTVLWEAISGSAGVSVKTALRGLEGHFGKKKGAKGPRGHTFVVLMDELDQLLTAKQDVVYNFFNWPTMRDSQMFVIAVANRMDLPQHLAAKIKSRLGLQTLLFQPYDRQNLIDIVQSRLVKHPKSDADHKVLLQDAIALAATKMAGTNGDARRVLDACRRAVEVTIEKKKGDTPRPVTAKEMMAVLNQMSSSPVAMFVKGCSEQQKMMLAAMVRCVRREGVPEIAWRAVRSDHDNLTRSLLETNDLLSPSELLIVFTSLIASHALTAVMDHKISQDDRRVALGMEIGEVGRVLMGEGESWRRALAGT